MNLNNFTIKSQEAVQQAVQLVQKNNQQVIEPVHLLKAVNLICQANRMPFCRKQSTIPVRWATSMFLWNILSSLYSP